MFVRIYNEHEQVQFLPSTRLFKKQTDRGTPARNAKGALHLWDVRTSLTISDTRAGTEERLQGTRPPG